VREQAVLNLLRVEGPMSRAEIARRCSVSKPTVSSDVETLLALGLVEERGRGTSGNGRPGRLVAFNPTAGYVVGMDVGGTTTRAVLTDLDGRVVASHRADTESGSADALLEQLGDVVERLVDARTGVAPVLDVAIGTPGVVDPVRRRVAIAPNLPALEADGFLDRLDAALGRPVTLLNDVKSATRGELEHGAGRGVDDLVYVSIGTGLGLGVVVAGVVHHGVGGRAGELGLLPYPPGSDTILEDALSGRGIRSHSLAVGGDGDPATAFRQADAGLDPGTSAIERFQTDLAWALVAVVTLLDPRRIVLGGGIGLRCAPFIDRIRADVARHAGFDIDVRVAELGDDAGLTGAVATALEPARDVRRWMEGGPQRSNPRHPPPQPVSTLTTTHATPLEEP
jgi:predicted NBD/HSP70 family sugar kinase